jgi:predicted nucleic acid-binding protein
MKLFLDTNVYIDFLLVRKPFDREAISIISSEIPVISPARALELIDSLL